MCPEKAGKIEVDEVIGKEKCAESRIGVKAAEAVRWLTALSELAASHPAWETYRRELDGRMGTIALHQREDSDIPVLYDDVALCLREQLAPTARLELESVSGFVIGDAYQLLFIGCEQEAEILFTMQPEPRVLRQNLTLKLTSDRFHVLLLEGFDDETSPGLQRIGTCELDPRQLISEECILDFDLADIKIRFQISIEPPV